MEREPGDSSGHSLCSLWSEGKKRRSANAHSKCRMLQWRGIIFTHVEDLLEHSETNPTYYFSCPALSLSAHYSGTLLSSETLSTCMHAVEAKKSFGSSQEMGSRGGNKDKAGDRMYPESCPQWPASYNHLLVTHSVNSSINAPDDEVNTLMMHPPVNRATILGTSLRHVSLWGNIVILALVAMAK